MVPRKATGTPFLLAEPSWAREMVLPPRVAETLPPAGPIQESTTLALLSTPKLYRGKTLPSVMPSMVETPGVYRRTVTVWERSPWRRVKV